MAVTIGDTAMPLALVDAMAVRTALGNVPLAPAAGNVNVTLAPDTGLLPASRTVACSTAANGVETKVDCGVPPVAAMLAAAPAVLVNAKLAGVATPGAVAVAL